MRAHTLRAWFLGPRIPAANRPNRGRALRGAAIVAGGLLIGIAVRPMLLQASDPARSAEPHASLDGAAEQELPQAAHDPVYEQFLQRIRRLQRSATRRRYLVREVVAAANQSQIDPDLLFALVAVESNFDSAARSSKGARGLGQLMFATAHSIAPALVRRPGDLYNVHRNLFATALLLRHLLIAQEGDLQAALRVYHLGAGDGHLSRRAAQRYIGRICTYFASLKAKREFRELIAMNPQGPGPSGNASGQD